MAVLLDFLRLHKENKETKKKYCDEQNNTLTKSRKRKQPRRGPRNASRGRAPSRAPPSLSPFPRQPDWGSGSARLLPSFPRQRQAHAHDPQGRGSLLGEGTRLVGRGAARSLRAHGQNSDRGRGGPTEGVPGECGRVGWGGGSYRRPLGGGGQHIRLTCRPCPHFYLKHFPRVQTHYYSVICIQ